MVTDEMVERAAETYWRKHWCVFGNAQKEATKQSMRAALEAALNPPPQSNVSGLDLADTIRRGIKDQGYGYTLKGDKLTVSSDEVFAIDLAKLADFIRAALATEGDQLPQTHSVGDWPAQTTAPVGADPKEIEVLQEPVAWQAKGIDGIWRYVEMPRTAAGMGMEIRGLVPVDTPAPQSMAKASPNKEIE